MFESSISREMTWTDVSCACVVRVVWVVRVAHDRKGSNQVDGGRHFNRSFEGAIIDFSWIHWASGMQELDV